jgi:hypothetical protein
MVGAFRLFSRVEFEFFCFLFVKDTVTQPKFQNSYVLQDSDTYLLRVLAKFGDSD